LDVFGAPLPCVVGVVLTFNAGFDFVLALLLLVERLFGDFALATMVLAALPLPEALTTLLEALLLGTIPAAARATATAARELVMTFFSDAFIEPGALVGAYVLPSDLLAPVDGVSRREVTDAFEVRAALALRETLETLRLRALAAPLATSRLLVARELAAVALLVVLRFLFVLVEAPSMSS
jgi:hypothetical protein